MVSGLVSPGAAAERSIRSTRATSPEREERPLSLGMSSRPRPIRPSRVGGAARERRRIRNGKPAPRDRGLDYLVRSSTVRQLGVPSARETERQDFTYPARSSTSAAALGRCAWIIILISAVTPGSPSGSAIRTDHARSLDMGRLKALPPSSPKVHRSTGRPWNAIWVPHRRHAVARRKSGSARFVARPVKTFGMSGSCMTGLAGSSGLTAGATSAPCSLTDGERRAEFNIWLHPRHHPGATTVALAWASEELRRRLHPCTTPKNAIRLQSPLIVDHLDGSSGTAILVFCGDRRGRRLDAPGGRVHRTARRKRRPRPHTGRPVA